MNTARSDALSLLRWADDGGPGSPLVACQDSNDEKSGGTWTLAEGRRPPVGGLLVLTGYASERLGYLAALLSETLAEALWAPPPELHGGEREVRLALKHLLAGTTVVQLAETSQLGLFRDLAERSGARFLHVLSPPPSGPGAAPEHPAEPDTTQQVTPERVVLEASASLRTQFEVVRATWSQPRGTP